LELFRDLGDDSGATRALVGVCQVLVALGKTECAESLSLELLESCALIRGDCEEAAKRYRQSLRAALPLGDLLETSFEVQGVAMSVAGLGELHAALRLAGAVEALWESLGTWISVRFWDSLLERYIGAARAQLGAEANAVWAEGRALAFDDAVELALAD